VTDSCDPVREEAASIGGETELMALAETVDLKAFIVSADFSKTGAAKFGVCFSKEDAQSVGPGGNLQPVSDARTPESPYRKRHKPDLRLEFCKLLQNAIFCHLPDLQETRISIHAALISSDEGYILPILHHSDWED
jgi:hypothetical protein